MIHLLFLSSRASQKCFLLLRLKPPLTEISEICEDVNSNELFPLVQVVLPMLCSYMSHWWEHGPESIPDKADSCCTSVTSEHMNTLLGNILKIIYNNLGIDEGAWMKRLAGKNTTVNLNMPTQYLDDHSISKLYLSVPNLRDQTSVPLLYIMQLI